jgi:hypothetical protein
MSGSSAATKGVGQAMSRTSLQLYRDIFRLIKHIAGNSPKGVNLRNVVRMEFKKSVDLTVSSRSSMYAVML